MATKTAGFKEDKLSMAPHDSVSIRVHEHKAQLRKQALRSTFNTTPTLKQYLRKLY